ncbi:complex I assembly factor TIMMDC1, mitochondrial isoform X2 [Hippocampus zosterae]|uniref:complex I assembly factor TIMMDC1, mitochondrial isoform X2 n=1 Tax=Hippocampus zosterae TaxID=109293 RepID=UPI00223E37B0|nr:complex I assembly factor TIMMDC1, mitochondrial isoform X2 [Hippocampus zosterae]
MHPQQPTTGFTLRRQLADSAPRGTLSTGPAQGPGQSARRPRFCLLLPGVHAADVSSGQPAQMPSSPSSTCVVAPPHPSALPSNIGKPEFPDTGWDRIKDLFQKDATQGYPEEVTSVVKSGLVASLAGLIYGGLPAARHARQRYIQLSQAELYTSRVEAVRSVHHAAIRGFVRYGLRWSWRVAAFVSLFKIPTGAVIISMHSLTGESPRERRRRERRETYENKLAEWKARLDLTDELIGDLSEGSQPEATKRDLKRIQELLSLPQNDAVREAGTR